jgi:anti-anti-sigma regulatory factor
MKLSILEEHPDGSATVTLEDVSPEIMQLIVQTGFLKLLTDALNEAEANNKLPALLRAKE